MKVTSFSYLHIIGALALGLAVAWNTVIPRPIHGEHTTGGCPPCSGWDVFDCPDKPSKNCVDNAYRCTGSSNDGKCIPYPGAQNSCVEDPKCVGWLNEWCDE